MNDLTWKEAIKRVLQLSGAPLHTSDITDKIVELNLRSSLGATPQATVGANIYTSIKRDGPESPFIKVSKGVFALRRSGSSITCESTDSMQPTLEDDIDDQYYVISSFGMFWQRDAVLWKPAPKLLGMQRINSDEVNFSNQLGVYLLYDGREVIYVGRSVDRPLGKRLYEHTVDRLATRWDRFSWFGLLAVSEDGQLGALPSLIDASKTIAALEAILIEALEPRQNRKRGDDLGTVEYMQKEDSEVQKRRLLASVDSLINKSG